MIPLRDTRTSGRFPFITLFLILLNCLVFYFELMSPDLDSFFTKYALIPAQVSLHQPQTLIPFITSLFLHGGVIHLISNMWFLWIFGDNVEDRFGLAYLPFYLLGGIIGAVAQYFISPHAAVPIVGASGAIAAVLGAYLMLFPGHTVKTLVPILFFFTVIDLPAFVMLGYWFFVQLFNGYAAVAVTAATSGGVAYFAHIGGFAYGWIVSIGLPRTKKA